MLSDSIMNSRKKAFEKGLQTILRRPARPLGKGRPSKASFIGRKLLKIGPSLYNRAGMLETNQIIQGDSITMLDTAPPRWIDLVFADPPFNIGYLYHGYNDERNDDDYLQFSTDWMKSVHRASSRQDHSTWRSVTITPPTWR